MEKNKKYYTDIGLIRIVACLGVLLYHLNILKGGYLAVCTFFVLSAYLSCISAFRKEKFSLLSYYKKLILKIYLPLMIVVFLTISAVSFFPSIIWTNLKPETTSVLLGYNNFWQLSASQDYFARHINSPFLHLWYVSLMLQFDFVFPFIYLILRKIEEKTKKIVPCLIITALSIIGVIYFYIMSLTQNIMVVYYGTFTRIFALLFGLLLGFLQSNYNSFIPKKLKENKTYSRIVFYSYLLILAFLFILVDIESIYWQIGMVLTTIITCRLINYGTIEAKENFTIFDKIIKILSDISYEIYLVQYPIIFLFQYVDINTYLKIPIIILLVLALSFILHYCMNIESKNKKINILIYITSILILGFSIHGGYKYYIAKDNTPEMKQLRNQLAENEKIFQSKQEEYALRQKESIEVWASTLEELQNDESKIDEMVANLPVVGIGDSVMLGAIENLYAQFPNGYFDAKISRTGWVVNGILQDLKNRNILSNTVVLGLGTNGDCPTSCKVQIMEKCKDAEVFWLNVTNDQSVHVNNSLNKFASQYDNLHIIDWNSISKGHPEYFVADGIHLTGIGREAYKKAIYDAIYDVYSNKNEEKKQEIIKQHNEELKTKMSFYGNDILLNAFEDLQNNFVDAKFNIKKDFNYKSLKKQIEKDIQDNSLNYKVILAFDSTLNLNDSEIQELINLCSNHQVYIFLADIQNIDDLNSFNSDTVKIFDILEEFKKHDNYLLFDGIHLNEDGNKILIEFLKNSIQ